MIRLIPLLAAFVVLLWHPTEGWSEESNILLEPDAVLTGTLEYEYLGAGPVYNFSDGKCNLQFSLKNYKIDKWLKCSKYKFKITGKIRSNGTIETLKIESYYFFSWRWELTGNISEVLVGYDKGNSNDSDWKAVLKLSNPEYERRKAQLSGEAKETRVAAEPSLKRPDPEKIASLLEPDAVLTGKLELEGLGFSPWRDRKCNLQFSLKNYKIDKWFHCFGFKYKIIGEIESNGTIETLQIQDYNYYPSFSWKFTGNISDVLVSFDKGDPNVSAWKTVLKLSNPNYERRKAQLSGQSKETRVAEKPSLKRPDPEKIARVEKAEKARRLAEEEKQLAELARLKAAEKERKAEIARLKAEEEELAEIARLRAAEKERKAEIARLKVEEEERARQAELARRKTEEAKQQAELVSSSVHFGTYHALVIGNDEYTDLPKLKNGVQDAKDMSLLLKDMYGFEVQTLLNASRDDIIGALSKFRAKLKYDNNLLIYYAGHGFLDDATDEGYWLPVDAGEDDPSNWIAVSTITNMVKAIRAKHVMVVADSCYSGTLVRSTPAKLLTAKERDVWLRRMAKKRARTALVSGGLEPVMDSGGGKNSPFAKALMDVLRDNQSVMEGSAVYEALKRPVALASSQTPEYSDIRRAGHDGGDFLFVRTGGVKAQASTSEQLKVLTDTPKQPSEQVDMLFWQSVKDSSNVDMVREYLKQFPDGMFAGLARIRIKELEAAR